jgi:hypothetical protein
MLQGKFRVVVLINERGGAVMHSRCSPLPLLALGVATTAIAALPTRAAALPPGVTQTQVTDDPTFIWGEPEVAVNPKNPDNLVYAVLGNGNTAVCQDTVAQDSNSDCAPVKTAVGPMPLGMMDNRPSFSHVSVYVSFDRGKSWKKSTDIPGKIPVFPPGDKLRVGLSADPMIAAGPNGTFYLAWDAAHFANLPTTFSEYGGIATSKSSDGGRTWSQPVFTGTTTDRPFMHVDQSSGIIYEASTGPVPSPMGTGDPTTQITSAADRYLTSSRDGVHWTKPQPFGGGGLRIAPAHGMLATVFKTDDKSKALCGNAPAPCTIFQTTKDAGATWERHVVPVPNTYEGRLSAGNLIAADPARAGHYAIAMFTDASKQVSIYQTHDAGKTWSAAAQIVDENGKSPFHSWMAYSPNGALGLIWKTHNVPSGTPAMAASPPFAVYATISRDGGTTFTHPLKISDEETPAPRAPPGGDDVSFLAMTDDELFVAFAAGNRAGVLTTVKLSAFTH